MIPSPKLVFIGAAVADDGLDAALEGLDGSLCEWNPGDPVAILAEATVLLGLYGKELESEVEAARAHTRAPLIVLTAEIDRDVLQRASALDALDVVDYADGAADMARLEFAVTRAAAAADVAAAPEATVSPLHRCKVLTVLAPKGGAGASTLAANMAVAAATNSNGETLLADFDLTGGDVGTMLGLNLERTLLEAILSQGDLDLHKIRGFALRHDSGAHVLPAPLRPQDAALMPPERLLDLLAAARVGYSTIVVNADPWSGDTLLAALDVTDSLLLVTTPDVSSLKSTQQLLRYLDELDFPRDRRHVVLNRHRSGTNMSTADIAQTLGTPVAWKVREDDNVRDFGNRGQALVTSKAKSPAAKDMKALVRDLLDDASGNKRSLLGRKRNAVHTGADRRKAAAS